MTHVDAGRKLRSETPQGTQMVKCDVCGRHYNQRYLKSHKRLSHDAKGDAASVDESRAVETILSLYKKISIEARTELLRRLRTAPEEA